MTQEQHPITPPPDLMQQWYMEAENQPGSYYAYITTQAARWGADQELGACCEWIDHTNCDNPQEIAEELRAARRPKPPSLKERALEEIGAFEGMGTCNIDIIRRALEALPND
jgi:hypothetical protein